MQNSKCSVQNEPVKGRGALSVRAKLANRSAQQVLKSVWVNCDEIEFLLPLL